MNKTYLIIQTAFTGDVILATALIEKLAGSQEGVIIDLLVRKGNESLFINHPFLREVLTWNKKENKYENFIKTIRRVRKNKYDCVINLQRFSSTGILTALSGAKETRGFNKNPFSFLFTKKIKHLIEKGIHETRRNQSLIEDLTDNIPAKPKLYPSTEDFNYIRQYSEKPFITIAPASVWHTKTFPGYKWVELISLSKKQSPDVEIFLLGSTDEKDVAENIIKYTDRKGITNLCGQLTLLQSAALMQNAKMNYVNDSAPMHLASSMNAPVTAVYCSTSPDFGFGPLSDLSRIIETKTDLHCRPCGLHGYSECPLVHFKCAHTIEINEVIAP